MLRVLKERLLRLGKDLLPLIHHAARMIWRVALWQVPHYRTLDAIMQAVFVLACYAAYEVGSVYQFVLPGMAIGALALGALLISLRPPSSRAESASWLLISLVLMVSEVRILIKDRQDQTAQYRRDALRAERAFRVNQEASEALLKKSNKALEDNSRLLAEIAKTNRLASSSLSNITGGSAFAYANFDGHGGVFLVNPSDATLRNVTVRIVDFSRHTPALDERASMRELLSLDRIITVGDLAARSAIHEDLQQPMPSTAFRANLFFSALNGFWSEQYERRVIDSTAVDAFIVTRQEKNKEIVLRRLAPKGFAVKRNGDPVLSE